ncbi:penicillin-binding protein activator [Acetobacter persici]|nr:penicillin-binding protein activator [Acetobacter persici]MCG0996539.1 penicillin-binding protein activator [Acetobacter persici]
MMTRTYSFLSKASTRGLAGNGAGRKTGMVVLGAVGLAMAGCADQSGTGTLPAPQEPKAATSHKIGVLLPLTGPNAALGHELLAGAQLALAESGAATAQGPSQAQAQAQGRSAALQMDVHDTAAAGGASAAVTAAVEAGDGIILGPLTAVDTAAAAPAAQSASLPVLAFTSDVNQARDGVWVMGITPEDQVERLVATARKEGRQHFAAFLPDNPLGHALGNGLLASCRDQGLTTPTIVYHTGSAASITQMMRELSAYDTRKADAQPDGSAPAQTADATAPDKTLPSDLAAALNGGSGSASASTDGTAQPAAPKLAPPPFDALLLGDTGLGLKNVIGALADSQVSSSSVRIMGPGLWAAFASKLGALKGAWYAAPDPSSRQSFVTRFMARNHHMPRPLADLSYDAATVATTVARTTSRGYPVSALTRQEGFAGVDGQFTLLPDGRTRRALGVFEVLGNGGGAKLLVPATTKTSVAG